ncbi:MAG: PIN domain-containing protein [Bryobacteraceae bacterium]
MQLRQCSRIKGLYQLVKLIDHIPGKVIQVEVFIQDVGARFVVKPVTGRIAVLSAQLSDIYPRDPIDRLIGATALAEGMALVTADQKI